MDSTLAWSDYVGRLLVKKVNFLGCKELDEN